MADINKTYTSNTLYNDSTGVIAFAEQLKQELINWANYHHVTEELGPDNRPDTQNALNNLFLSIYERFLTFLNDADATEEAINTWKEIENFLADYTDEKTLAEIVAELNANIESRLTVPLESTTGSSTTSTMTQKAITEAIDASKTFTTGEKVDNVGIDDEPTAGSNNLVKSGGVQEKLNQLAQEITDQIANNIITISSKYWTLSGTSANSGYYDSSQKIALSKIDITNGIELVSGRISGNGSSVPSAIFFDENGDYIDNSAYLNSVVSPNGIPTSAIPQNAYFVAFNRLKSSTIPTRLLGYGLASEVSSIATDTQKNTTNIVNNNNAVGYFFDKQNATTSSLYISRITHDFKAGDKVYLLCSSSVAENSTDLTVKNDANTVVKYLTLNIPQVVTIAANTSYLEVRAVSASAFTTGGDVIFYAIEGLAKDAFERDDVCNNKISEIEASENSLESRFGYFFDKQIASTTSLYISRITHDFKNGNKLLLIFQSTTAQNEGRQLTIKNDQGTVLGYCYLNVPKTITLSADTTYLEARGSSATAFTEGGEVVFTIYSEESKETYEAISKNKQDILLNNQEIDTINQRTGGEISISKDSVAGRAFSLTIPGNFKAGQKVKLTILGDGLATNATIAFVSDAFSSTQYIILPNREKEVTLVASADSISVSINGSNVTTGSTLTAKVLFRSIVTLPFNHRMTPVITLIDDDTNGIPAVTKFYDACVANGIVGTFAMLTGIVENSAELRTLLKSYERAGFEMVLHSHSQTSVYEYATRDLAAVESDFVLGLQEIQEMGFINHNYWVTPYGVADADLQNLAKKWGLKCLVSIGQNMYIGENGGNYIGEYNRFKMPRPGFNAEDSQGSVSFAQLKALMDSASLEGGWILVGTHMWNGWTQELINTRFKEMVDYAKALGFQFRTLGHELDNRLSIFKFYEAI